MMGDIKLLPSVPKWNSAESGAEATELRRLSCGSSSVPSPLTDAVTVPVRARSFAFTVCSFCSTTEGAFRSNFVGLGFGCVREIGVDGSRPRPPDSRSR